MVLHCTLPSMSRSPNKTVSQVWHHYCRLEGGIHLLGPAGNASHNAVQAAIRLCCQNMLLVQVQLELQVIFCQAAFQLCGNQHALVPGMVPSHVAGLCTSHCWPLWGSSQSVFSACGGPPGWQHHILVYSATAPRFVSSANLLRVHLVPVISAYLEK